MQIRCDDMKKEEKQSNPIALLQSFCCQIGLVNDFFSFQNLLYEEIQPVFLVEACSFPFTLFSRKIILVISLIKCSIVKGLGNLDPPVTGLKSQLSDHGIVIFLVFFIQSHFFFKGLGLIRLFVRNFQSWYNNNPINPC